MAEDLELEKIKMKKISELMRKSKEVEKNMADAPLELNQSNFDKTINESPLPVLVDFYATWCMPCKMMAPVVADLARKYSGKILVGKVDVDRNPKLAVRYQIMSVPTFMVFKNGKPVDRILGAVGSRLEEIIRVHV
ncbi:MAG: thioredoxin [Candidatus Odinarchaeum yellowstonii]|uniref:Thioredoxin n=1 Tax=Odinarchaeota yellowstonii (strain LCB_4) TaxID=1841599 RepID=A0AAF0D378_ODILC|nr:MAG: thioredoxin [Candidatus Odinarchaeum yellowstonii]